jgi:hypothetical protein
MVLGVGCWMLGVGCWVLGVGCWVLGVGCWVLGVGCWVLGAVNQRESGVCLYKRRLFLLGGLFLTFDF